MITDKDVYVGNNEKIASCFNPDCCSAGRNLYLHNNFDYVWCHSCGVRGPINDGHPKDAISDWNNIQRP